MVREHAGQVEAGQDVAVEDEERPADVPLDVLEGAGGAERLVLDDVGELHPEAGAVAEVLGDRLREVAGRQDRFVDPGLLQSRQRPFEERDPADRDHRFRRAIGQRPQPRPLATD